jgi:hypothetical protein
MPKTNLGPFGWLMDNSLRKWKKHGLFWWWVWFYVKELQGKKYLEEIENNIRIFKSLAELVSNCFTQIASKTSK